MMRGTILKTGKGKIQDKLGLSSHEYNYSDCTVNNTSGTCVHSTVRKLALKVIEST